MVNIPGTFSATEIVELRGHIIDSLLLPKIMDMILSRGGGYSLEKIEVGQTPIDPSFARIQVQAKDASHLEEILRSIHEHGAMPVQPVDCSIEPADMDAAFPENFYSSTNHKTEIRYQGQWLKVQDQEMDCGIVLDPVKKTAQCIPMLDVKKGMPLVCGHRGIKVLPEERTGKKGLFEFMSSAVSSEKPKSVAVREVAAAMKRTKADKQRTIAVLGPAVVHTGGVEHMCDMIRRGYIDVIFAGNALATHDIEQSFYGTSLGVYMDRGLPAEEGHEHHLRAINRIRRCGSIKQAVEKGVLKSGIMYECVKNNVTFVLSGSVRDDGPLPDVITDMVVAQNLMREHIREGVGFCLMIGTALLSIATGNILPAWVKVACVDINPATVTKLMDRGSSQTVGIVTDAEPFLRELANELRKENA